MTIRRCISCGKSSWSKERVKIATKVSKYLVENYLSINNVCHNCGYYDLSESKVQKQELLAAQAVLLDPSLNIDGAIIKFVRKSLGFTKNIFASKVGHSLSSISRIENDDQQPNSLLKVQSICLIAQALHPKHIKVLGKKNLKKTN